MKIMYPIWRWMWKQMLAANERHYDAQHKPATCSIPDGYDKLFERFKAAYK